MFNGNEVQQEIPNVSDFNARFYDNSLGRFMMVDPLADKQLQFNPYHFSYNNPIRFNDPSGLFGEYYGVDGTYLGSDGIDDNKAYVVYTSGDETPEVITEELSVSNSELMLLASTSYGESSTANNPVEMAAISNTIVNNQGVSPSGTTLTEAIDGFALAASDGNARASQFDSTEGFDKNGTSMQDAISGAINAVTGGNDFSNGATHWAGDDVGSSSEKRATGGLLVNDSSHDIHSVGSKKISGAPITEYWRNSSGQSTGVRGTYSYTWETTAGYGGKTGSGRTTGTTFMKKTKDFLKATGAPAN